MDYKILIVGGEPDIVSMIASLFTGKGYQTLSVPGFPVSTLRN